MLRSRLTTTVLTALCLAGCARTHARTSAMDDAGDPGGAAAREAALVQSRLMSPVRVVGAPPPPAMRLADRLAFYKVPGVSIAVVRGNRLRWAATAGVKQAGSADSIRLETLFQAASISKPISAFAALRLVDQGRLSLDRPINETLRSWRIPDNEFTAGHPVTLRQVLSHSAGLTNGAVGIYPPDQPVPTLLQALDGSAPSRRPPVRVDFVPGTQWRYAGGGYSVLQQLLLDVTGETFPALTERLVFAPLEMRNSTFSQPLAESLARRAAAGHDRRGGVIAGRWWTLPEMAAGGLWTTASDLGRFIVALNTAWSGDSGGRALLSAPLAREMMRPQSAAGGWGLGVAVDSSGGELRVSHTGSNDGYRAVLVAFPARGDGIVVLTNGDNGGSLRDEIVRAAAALYGWPGYAQEERPAVAITPALEAELLGSYDYGRGFMTRIERVGDRLVARLNDGPAYELFAASPEELFTLEGTVYRVEREASGSVVGIRAELGGPPLLGRKVR